MFFKTKTKDDVNTFIGDGDILIKPSLIWSWYPLFQINLFDNEMYNDVIIIVFDTSSIKKISDGDIENVFFSFGNLRVIKIIVSYKTNKDIFFSFLLSPRRSWYPLFQGQSYCISRGLIIFPSHSRVSMRWKTNGCHYYHIFYSIYFFYWHIIINI